MRDALPEARDRPRLIVVGVGNRWRGDDAAGLAVAERVGGLAHEGDCARLLEMWGPADAVALVDAAASCAAPGTVHRIDPLEAPVPAALLRSSSHAFGVLDAVELARALDRLPHSLRLYGIEGGSFALGNSLTPPVRQAVAALSDELRRGCRRLRRRD